MNKEQWTFLAALALFGLGVFLAATGWVQEKKFQPPAIKNRAGAAGAAIKVPPPVFSAEEEQTAFAAGGRDPFRAKTDLEDLPLPELPVPPLADLRRVAPGPLPGLGSFNLRVLEEAVAAGKIEFKAAAKEGEGEEEGGKEEGGGEHGRW
jgi:hypothetical protein